MIMLANKRWKYTHFEGFDAMLHDMENDPDELVDLGTDQKFEKVRALFSDWAEPMTHAGFSFVWMIFLHDMRNRRIFSDFMILPEKTACRIF